MKKRGNEYKCYYCGRDEWCTKHHFFPKSPYKKSVNPFANYEKVLVYACSKCQRIKANHYPNVFLELVESHPLYTMEEVARIKIAVLSLLELLKSKT